MKSPRLTMLLCIHQARAENQFPFAPSRTEIPYMPTPVLLALRFILARHANLSFPLGTGTSFVEGRESIHDKESQDWLVKGESRASKASTPPAHDSKSHVEHGALSWLKRRSGNRLELLDDERSVAQVDPLRLSYHKSFFSSRWVPVYVFITQRDLSVLLVEA